MATIIILFYLLPSHSAITYNEHNQQQATTEDSTIWTALYENTKNH